MKLDLLIKPFLLGFAALTMVGCASVSDKNDADASGDGMSGESTEVSGLGSDDEFGGDGRRKRSTLRVENQTYYFDFNQSDVKPEDRGSVNVQGKHLATNPGARVLLEGNTDPRGSREYNIALGERRATAVANALKAQGASGKQIRTVSYGAEKRAVSGSSEEAYQLDRRANLVYESK
jgi:peptidoglycan-associated lipoprotein